MSITSKITIAAAMAAMLCHFSASAYDFESNGLYYSRISGKDAEVKVDKRLRPMVRTPTRVCISSPRR